MSPKEADELQGRIDKAEEHVAEGDVRRGFEILSEVIRDLIREALMSSQC